MLWGQNYYGEGLWGKGQSLLSGRYTNNSNPEAAPDVRSLCGGAYRGRGRKRKGGKEKPKLSYAERQQKRISRKFGKHGEGNTVGEDLYAKERLEKGRQTSAKPKVANSKRGRELRAAAALARFDQAKTIVKEEEPDTVIEDDSTESETESEGGDDEPQLMDGNDKAVLDRKGHPLFKVCDDEDMRDEDARRELDELLDLNETPKTSRPVTAHPATKTSDTSRPMKRPATTQKEESVTKRQKSSVQVKSEPVSAPLTGPLAPNKSSSVPVSASPTKQTASTTTHGQLQTCLICSLVNESDAATCLACANVLDANKVSGTWRCTNQQCAASGYLNAGDAGVCGICGRSRT